MNITIIGLGLIVGLLALDLRDQEAMNFYGYESNQAHADQALILGLVDKVICEEEVLSFLI